MKYYHYHWTYWSHHLARMVCASNVCMGPILDQLPQIFQRHGTLVCWQEITEEEYTVFSAHYMPVNYPA